MKPLSGTARGCEIIRWFSPKLKSFKSFFSYICLQNAQHRRHSRVCQASGALGSGRRGRSGAALPTWPTKATFWFKPAGRFLRGQVQSPRGLSSHPPLSCTETCARAQAHPHPPNIRGLCWEISLCAPTPEPRFSAHALSSSQVPNRQAAAGGASRAPVLQREPAPW